MGTEAGVDRWRGRSWSAAELRVHREALGLSGRWLADWLGVRERTLIRWESGDSPVPEWLPKVVDALEAEADVWALRLDDLADQDGVVTTFRVDADVPREWRPLGGSDPEPELVYPASWHRALVGRYIAGDRSVGVRYSSEV